jgi:predicted nucleotidyltransferase
MFLFGSRAWGKPHQDSDIDLIIVSPTFRKKKPLARGLNLYDHWSLDYPVDFLCYTPEEFEKLKKKITIVKEAVERGIEIR